MVQNWFEATRVLGPAGTAGTEMIWDDERDRIGPVEVRLEQNQYGIMIEEGFGWYDCIPTPKNK